MAFFELLTPETQSRLDLEAEEMRVPAGRRFIKAGDSGGDIFRVVRGSLEVVDTRTKPEVILDVLGPGSVVGEMSFLTHEPRSADVRAFEDTLLLWWRAEALQATLDRDAPLAGDFYRAIALVMSERLHNASRVAASHVSGAGRARGPGDEIAGVRQLADAVKAELLRIDGPIRRDEAWARELLPQVMEDFLTQGARLFKGLGAAERAAAGGVLARELSPYLVRSKLAELALTSPGGRTGTSALLNHVEEARPRGADALGRALDRVLMALPTTRALQRRRGGLLDVTCGVLSEAPGDKITVINCGSGQLIAGLGLFLQEGGELTCVDADRPILTRLDAATIARSPDMKLRLVQEDLAAFALGRSALYFEPQDVVVLNGLAEYLPDRVLATAVRAGMELLKPGGVLVVDMLGPTQDGFLFDDTLGWCTLRRAAEDAMALLADVGPESLEVAWARKAAIVLTGRRPR
ncbi:MAG: cyclic nucleotide-binding domain-containing protein [Alphaproteobacteria bacterium]|nr:cyclic nucleotide-binding domain-containing protein [Alphaproteobacteria bacterium]